MIGDAQQAIGIRRQIYPHDIRAFVGDHVEKTGILVSESIVILAPHQRGDQQVDGGNRRAPAQLVLRLLQPFRMLVEHRIDDMHERLVRGKEAVPTSENVALEPAFECVLAEHFHDPAIGCDFRAVRVLGLDIRRPTFSWRPHRYHPACWRRSHRVRIPGSSSCSASSHRAGTLPAWRSGRHRRALVFPPARHSPGSAADRGAFAAGPR